MRVREIEARGAARKMSRCVILMNTIESLGYALTQVQDKTQRKITAQEFWHAMNRRGAVENSEVDIFIRKTIEIMQMLEESNNLRREGAIE